MQGTGQTSRGAHALVPTLANLPPEPDDPQTTSSRSLSAIFMAAAVRAASLP